MGGLVLPVRVGKDSGTEPRIEAVEIAEIVEVMEDQMDMAEHE